MRRAVVPLLTIVCSILSLAWQPASPSFVTPEPPAKVGRGAWELTANNSTADIIVGAPGYPDLSPALSLPTKEAKTRFVFETLTRFADQAQASLRRALAARKVPLRVLWLSNSIAIHAADRATVEWLAVRPDVAHIDLDVKARGIETPDISRQKSDDRWRNTIANRQSAIKNPYRTVGPQSVEWGVARVHAPEVWALGYRGQGIVLADLDTGVQWDHPALLQHYRGWNGITATHDYNWYDATGHSVSVPAFDLDHGTHTMGTLVGDDGAGHQIGVAPGAQWIACRNMDSGTGSVSMYTSCFQFALAPTDVNGNSPDPAKSADITNNSWSCWGQPPYNEAGCMVPAALLTVTQALRTAGVMVVAAAGNEGNTCGTIGHAPGTYDEAFSIGATDIGNIIAGFSSRGPSSFTGHIKPDLVAPGVSVNSSIPVNGYGIESGTSMATPHVAGIVALLWSAAPGLRGNIGETENILRRTAQPISTAETCGGVPGSSVPNNTYGYGLINAQTAVSEAFRGKLSAVPSASLSNVSDPLTFTVSLANYSALTRTNVVLTLSLPISTQLAYQFPAGIQAGSTISWTFAEVARDSVVSATMAITVSHAGIVALNDYRVNYTDGSAAPVAGAPASAFVFAHRSWLMNVMR